MLLAIVAAALADVDCSKYGDRKKLGDYQEFDRDGLHVIMNGGKYANDYIFAITETDEDGNVNTTPKRGECRYVIIDFSKL